MPKRKLEVGSVVKFFKICGRLTSTWPPNPEAQIRERVLIELMWWASFLIIVSHLLPLLLAVYHYRLQVDIFMKSLSQSSSLTEVFLNLILCRNQRHRLQVIFVMK